jgi:hypothetical protein
VTLVPPAVSAVVPRLMFPVPAKPPRATVENPFKLRPPLTLTVEVVAERTLAAPSFAAPPLIVSPPVLVRVPVSVQVPVPTLTAVPGSPAASAKVPAKAVDVLSEPNVRAAPPTGSDKRMLRKAPLARTMLPVVNVPPFTVSEPTDELKVVAPPTVTVPPFVIVSWLVLATWLALPPRARWEEIVPADPAPVTFAVPLAVIPAPISPFAEATVPPDWINSVPPLLLWRPPRLTARFPPTMLAKGSCGGYAATIASGIM